MNHYQFNDETFEVKFETCEFPPDLFSHEAHLRLAWIHIRKYGIDKALKNVEQQLKDYVKSVGAQDKYHQTLTIAAVKVVYHFMLKSEADRFADFIKEYPRLNTHFKALLEQHYDWSVIYSDHAKTTYVEPELLPFDL